MKNKIMILVILLVLSLVLTSIYATTDTVGNCANTDNQNHIRPLYVQVTSSSSGTLATVGANIPIGDSGNIATAIYSDSGGNPSSLLGNSLPISINSGWNDLNIQQSVTISSGTDYWLALEIGINQYWCYGGSDNNEIDSNLVGQVGQFPSTASNGGSYSESFNMRIIYSSSTTSTSTSSTSSTTATTTSTSTSTTATTTSTSILYPFSINSPFQLLIGDFNYIPYASYGILLLTFGLTIYFSKRFSIAMLLITLVGTVLYKLTTLSLNDLLVVVGLTIVVFIFEFFVKTKK